MTEIENRSGNLNIGSAGYVCKTSEFKRETDAPDGAELQVVDDAEYKVTKYCIAYEGKWYDR